MKRWYCSFALILFFCFACFPWPALALSGGDIAAAHGQQIAAPGDQAVAPLVAAPDAVPADPGATVAAVVQQAAPLIPGKTGVLVALLAPLIGLLTNVWYRWRKNSKAKDEDRRRKLLKDLAFAGIAYANELLAQGQEMAATGAGRYELAADYVHRNSGSTVFSESEIDDQVHALLAQIPGVGATGTSYLPKPATL